jgi:hypothetical protein
VANRERQSLVVVGARPRADVIYEVLLGIVVVGGAGWIIEGLAGTPPLTKSVGAGGNAAIKGALALVVVAIAGYLLVQAMILNGRLGLVYGLLRDGAVYLAAPEALLGSRRKRLLCDGTVTVALKTDSGARGSSSTPATRVRFEFGGAALVVQVSAPVGEPGAAQASIRAWLEAHGISVKDVPYPTRGIPAAS